LGGRGLAAQRRQEPAFGVRDLVELLDDVNRDANRAALLGDRAGDGLADPPGRVGRQLVAAAVVELLHRADQAERALLDEVEEGCPASEVALRDEDHEAQIGLDHLLLGRVVAALDAPGQRALLCAGQQRHLAYRAQVQAQGVRRRLGGQVDRRLALVERSYRVLWHVVAFRMRGSSDLQPGRPADGLNRVVAPLVDATCRDREGAARRTLAMFTPELGSDVVQTLQLLVTELVDDAVTHAGQDIVELDLFVTPRYVRLTVSDAGPGFESRVSSTTERWGTRSDDQD